MNERDNLENPNITERIILKCILIKLVMGRGSEYRHMRGLCEYGKQTWVP
jgi:hypothetical protein